jgi:RNA polymerase sigma-70 factor (ECF subfamily)
MTPADAFTVMYERNQGAVFGLLYSLVGDVELAHDLAQDVWFRAWRYMAAHGWTDCPWPWVLTITANVFRDYLRSQKTRQTVFDRLCLTERTATEPSEPVTPPAGLAAAWRALPADQRVVLEMTFCGEMDRGEVARVLGIQPGSVAARKCRGLQTLRQEVCGEK